MMYSGENIFIIYFIYCTFFISDPHQPQPECTYLDESAGLELVVVERIQHLVHGHQLAGSEAGHLKYGSINASFVMYSTLLVHISDRIALKDLRSSGAGTCYSSGCAVA